MISLSVLLVNLYIHISLTIVNTTNTVKVFPSLEFKEVSLENKN